MLSLMSCGSDEATGGETTIAVPATDEAESAGDVGAFEVTEDLEYANEGVLDIYAPPDAAHRPSSLWHTAREARRGIPD